MTSRFHDDAGELSRGIRQRRTAQSRPTTFYKAPLSLVSVARFICFCPTPHRGAILHSPSKTLHLHTQTAFYPLFHFTAFLLDDGVGGKFNTMILSPKPVTITFVNSAVSGLYPLYRQLPVPLLPLSFTPNLITVILSTYYINSLSVNYPVSSRSITLLIVLS